MFLMSSGKKGRQGRDQKTIHRIKKYQKDVWKVLSCVIINPNTHGPLYVKILAAYVKIYPFVNSVDNRKAWLRETCSVNYGTTAKGRLADTSCCCIERIMQILLHTVFGCEVGILWICYKVTKRCRLSWLINIAIIYEPKFGERGGVEGSQPVSTAVHRRPNKLWWSNSMWVHIDLYSAVLVHGS